MEFHIKDHIKPDAKILLIKLRSIGDVVYNTAVYTPIKKHLPNANLTVLVESASYDIVKNHVSVATSAGNLIKIIFRASAE